LKIFEYVRNKFHPLWRIRRIKWLHRFLSSIDFQCSFIDKYTGFKIFIYWYRDFPFLLSNNYIFEKEVKDAMILILKFENISIFWDLGGNIGYYSLLISSLLPKCEIVAFEPFKKNIDLFTRSINHNKITNINLIGKAVSNKTGMKEFVVDDLSGATGQFFSLLREDDLYQISNAYGLRRTIHVETIKLDELIDNGFPIPDLMKVDIEEAEGLMFQGAQKIIERKETIIIIETFNINIINLFKKNGYVIFIIDDNSNYIFIPKRSYRLVNQFRKKYSEF